MHNHVDVAYSESIRLFFIFKERRHRIYFIVLIRTLVFWYLSRYQFWWHSGHWFVWHQNIDGLHLTDRSVGGGLLQVQVTQDQLAEDQLASDWHKAIEDWPPTSMHCPSSMTIHQNTRSRYILQKCLHKCHHQTRVFGSKGWSPRRGETDKIEINQQSIHRLTYIGSA